MLCCFLSLFSCFWLAIFLPKSTPQTVQIVEYAQGIFLGAKTPAEQFALLFGQIIVSLLEDPEGQECGQNQAFRLDCTTLVSRIFRSSLYHRLFSGVLFQGQGGPANDSTARICRTFIFRGKSFLIAFDKSRGTKQEREVAPTNISSLLTRAKLEMGTKFSS